MDKTYVKSVLERLKSSSSSQIQEALLKIKTSIITNAKGTLLFRECGGFESLLPHLRKPNERILDITLSILGNVCLDEKCSLEVAKLNSFGPLVSILNTVSRDSLLGRTSRVIGNLAQTQSNAESLHNYGAVQALITLIENRDKGTSYPTLLMAVRAIRLLWMVGNKREEMLSLNAVRCISVLLTTECESMGLIKSLLVKQEVKNPKKCQEDLINGILKCVGYFSTYAFVHCADQIQGDGRGYECLVSLMETHDSALKCVMNLCYLQTCRPLLGAAGLVETLVEILQGESDVSQWPPGAIRALSQLCRESPNRARMRRFGGLTLLLAAAKVDAHALRALLQFAFDDDSFQILTQEGLVGLLTEKLTYYVSTMDYDHDLKECESAEADETLADNGASIGDITEGERSRNSLTKTNLSSNITRKQNSGIRKLLERSNSNTSDVIRYEAEVRKRRKILKRSHSYSYATNEASDSSGSESDSWDPSVESSPAAFAKSPEQSDQMSLLCSEGYSSGISSEYGSSSSSKRARWDWSPSSGVSAGECSASPERYAPWSPASSGLASPASVHDVSDASDSELSGRYSPVCSEADEEDNNVTSVKSTNDTVAQDACNMDTLVIYDDSDDEPPPEDICNANIKSNANIGYVVTLLFRVAVGSNCSACGSAKSNAPSVKLLADIDCLHGLLDYVQKSRRPIGRAAKTLLRVVSNPLCLMSILKHRLPLRLHHMSLNCKHPPARCKQCQRTLMFSDKMLRILTINSESRYGVGEISHNFLKGTADIKQSLALTLPYIVKNEKALKTYLIDCDALNLLLNLICDAKEDLGTCVMGLSNLAANIHIKDPKVLEKRFIEQVIVNEDDASEDLSDNDIVTFILDDSSTVNTSKSFLCQHSEVFSAMLMGCFKESSEKCVQLKNVSQPALKYLITLLQFGLNDCRSDIKIFPITENLATSLEVLLLVDRFLFDKLKDLLRSAILQFQLTPETADKIYIWSLEEGMGVLCVESVAFILTGEMMSEERLQLFKNILNLEYKSQWLEDIKLMLFRQLEK